MFFFFLLLISFFILFVSQRFYNYVQDFRCLEFRYNRRFVVKKKIHAFKLFIRNRREKIILFEEIWIHTQKNARNQEKNQLIRNQFKNTTKKNRVNFFFWSSVVVLFTKRSRDASNTKLGWWKKRSTPKIEKNQSKIV